jgi:hypothetical protein
MGVRSCQGLVRGQCSSWRVAPLLAREEPLAAQDDTDQRNGNEDDEHGCPHGPAGGGMQAGPMANATETLGRAVVRVPTSMLE